ncbi:hypothetical protein GAMM_90010 [Gammaproteobacteria bacterium]
MKTLPKKHLKKEKLVFICNDDGLIYVVDCYFKKEQRPLDVYRNADSFLEKLSQYAKDIKICIDNSIKPEMSSFALAKQLHEAGYTKLYLLSAWDFDEKKKYEREYLPAPYELLEYLTAICKDENMLELL